MYKNGNITAAIVITAKYDMGFAFLFLNSSGSPLSTAILFVDISGELLKEVRYNVQVVIFSKHRAER